MTCWRSACGTGRHLRAPGPQAAAQRAVHRRRRLGADAGHRPAPSSPRRGWWPGDGYGLRFGDGAFDAVLAFEVLGHLPEIGTLPARAGAGGAPDRDLHRLARAGRSDRDPGERPGRASSIASSPTPTCPRPARQRLPAGAGPGRRGWRAPRRVLGLRPHQPGGLQDGTASPYPALPRARATSAWAARRGPSTLSPASRDRLPRSAAAARRTSSGPSRRCMGSEISRSLARRARGG